MLFFRKKKYIEVATYQGCKRLIYNDDGTVYCKLRLERNLEYFNKLNIRPCKED